MYAYFQHALIILLNISGINVLQKANSSTKNGTLKGATGDWQLILP